MRYPTPETIEGHRAQRPAPDFHLRPMALKFCLNYATRPQWSIRQCAENAGYGRGAKTRGAELLRDPRCLRAILHFGALAFAGERARVTNILSRLNDPLDEPLGWSTWNRWAMDGLVASMNTLAAWSARLDRALVGLAPNVATEACDGTEGLRDLAGLE